MAQFRLNDEEEAEQRQSVVVGSGKIVLSMLIRSSLSDLIQIRSHTACPCACAFLRACCTCRSARTIFDNIVAKTSHADIVYEDDATLAFRDTSPVAPVQCVLLHGVLDLRR